MIKKKVILLIVMLTFNLILISADTFTDCSIYGNCNIPKPSPTINYTTLNVTNSTFANNSVYLQGLTPSQIIDNYSPFINDTSTIYQSDTAKRVLIGGAVDDTSSALQVNGVVKGIYGYFEDGLGHNAYLASGAKAGNFQDGTNTVDIADGTNAMVTHGDVKFQDSGTYTNYIWFSPLSAGADGSQASYTWGYSTPMQVKINDYTTGNAINAISLGSANALNTVGSALFQDAIPSVNSAGGISDYDNTYTWYSGIGMFIPQSSGSAYQAGAFAMTDTQGTPGSGYASVLGTKYDFINLQSAGGSFSNPAQTNKVTLASDSYAVDTRGNSQFAGGYLNSAQAQFNTYLSSGSGVDSTDGVNRVYLCDNNYAINAYGQSHFADASPTTVDILPSGYAMTWDAPGFWGGNLAGSGGALYSYDSNGNYLYLADGNYAVNAVGIGSFANGNYQAVLADSGSFGAGTFLDGTNTATFADGISAGYFSDGTNAVYLSDGTNAIDVTGISQFHTTAGSATIGYGSTGGYMSLFQSADVGQALNARDYTETFQTLMGANDGAGNNYALKSTDASNIVTLANGTHAIGSLGNNLFEFPAVGSGATSLTYKAESHFGVDYPVIEPLASDGFPYAFQKGGLFLFGTPVTLPYLYFIDYTDENIQSWIDQTGAGVMEFNSYLNKFFFAGSFVDSINTDSVSPNARLLYDTSGTTVMDWSNPSTINVKQNLNISGNLTVKIPYATFSDNTTQVIGSALTPQVINFSTLEDSHQITLQNKQNISVLQAGDYNIQVSAIMTVDLPNKHVELWLQKTNSTGQFVNIPRTNTKMELATSSTEIPLAVSFIVDLLPTDKLRLMIASDDAGSSMVYTTNTSYSPESPSIIVSMFKIGEITP